MLTPYSIHNDDVVVSAFITGAGGRIVDSLSQVPQGHPLVLRGLTKKKYREWCAQNNHDYIYIDTGYFGNYKSDVNPSGKKQWHRVTVNATQQLFISDCDNKRLEELANWEPRLLWQGWRKDLLDKPILIIPPGGKAGKWWAFDTLAWLESLTVKLKQQTKRPFVIRPKPSRTDRVTENSIWDALDQAGLVIAHSSIAASEAILAGVPCCVLGENAAQAVSVPFEQIDNPVLHSANQINKWLCQLSYSQFTEQEMRQGTAWNYVKKA